MTDLYAACRNALAPEITDKHLVWVAEFCPDPFPRLEMSMPAERLRLVLLNLFDNAVKFSPPGGEVAVRFMYSDGLLMLLVQDRGPGIPAEQHERIFEPFTQLEPITTRHHDGAGLGLALVYNLVRLHGGGVEVANRPGGGARFEVSLPAAEYRAR